MKVMGRLGRMSLVRAVDRNMDRMIGTLCKIAAAFISDGRDVPPEIGRLIGLVEHRRNSFARVRSIVADRLGGPGVDKVVAGYLKEMKPMSESIGSLINVMDKAADV